MDSRTSVPLGTERLDDEAAGHHPDDHADDEEAGRSPPRWTPPCPARCRHGRVLRPTRRSEGAAFGGAVSSEATLLRGAAPGRGWGMQRSSSSATTMRSRFS